MNKLKNIKLKYIWISIFVAFFIALLLVWACANTDGALRTFIIVMLTLTFLYMTVAIQYAGARSFKFKPKEINYPTKTYIASELDFEPKLKKLGYKSRQADYGSIWTKVREKTAYKVVLVYDDIKYFNHDDTEVEKGEPNKELANCNKFICYEVFDKVCEDYAHRLIDFSVQGKQFYITAVCHNDDGNYVCPNYIEAQEAFKDAYNKILNDLGFKEAV
jgi:hypothetical protein